MADTGDDRYRSNEPAPPGDVDPEADTTGPDRRDRLADDRDRLADERDTRADDRDLRADERDLRADEREALVDERHLLADERERLLDERHRDLRDRADREDHVVRANAEQAGRLQAIREGLDRRLTVVELQEWLMNQPPEDPGADAPSGR